MACTKHAVKRAEKRRTWIKPGTQSTDDFGHMTRGKSEKIAPHGSLSLRACFRAVRGDFVGRREHLFGHTG
jgi:hypothetical protein